MVGVSIFCLLTFSTVFVKGFLLGMNTANSNENNIVNTMPGFRSYSDPIEPSAWRDNDDPLGKKGRDDFWTSKLRRPSTAAAAAAESAMAVTKSFADGMVEAVGHAVGNAVTRILENYGYLNPSSRRTTTNSNVNTNIVGRESSYNPPATSKPVWARPSIYDDDAMALDDEIDNVKPPFSNDENITSGSGVDIGSPETATMDDEINNHRDALRRNNVNSNVNTNTVRRSQMNPNMPNRYRRIVGGKYLRSLHRY